MSRLGAYAAEQLDRVGRAAGAAILRELAERLEATAEAVEEQAPLDRALERRVAELEQALVPLLEASVSGRRRRESGGRIT